MTNVNDDDDDDAKVSWDELKSKRPIGTQIDGVVARREVYGIFVDINEAFLGLLEVTSMVVPAEGIDVIDMPRVGERISATILGYDDRSMQVRLSTGKRP